MGAREHMKDLPQFQTAHRHPWIERLWQADGMPQPEYVPLKTNDGVRPGERLPRPDPWLADRPADFATPQQPEGRLMGSPGPDQGYGIKLAKHFASRIQLGEHEHLADAVAGCVAVGLKRAALFGRAPVVYDFELAYTLWGFLGEPPADLLEFRKQMFAECSHHYEDLRAIADAVPESTLRLSPAEVASSLGAWKTLISAD